ncbi:ankyrin repeat domain-containing protein (plasmid) [Streptomyces sp. HU2014]|uniref:ankyrin repeat domain-containing protein n=1 Tax=Streptomyces sp. HU2014 TaxID=2939414 RepID=UPI00200FC608|nr:ankyrin repeat domain-containing protein [Streptomyces sp. HU2014]UQI49764.1 ankyrin repeat domain-containing protein [Streptomyces sp. HU2014]
MDNFRPLSRYIPSDNEPAPPRWWYAPARVPHTAEVGRGPQARILLTGWEVWPSSLGIRLSVFRRRTGDHGGGRPEGLRFSLLLADGRCVSTLDHDPYSADRPGEEPTLQVLGGSADLFHYGIELYLSQLPPEGPLTLITEWPALDVPEERTVFDGTVLRAAASQAVEIWQDLPPWQPREGEEGGFSYMTMGPGEIMARPAPLRFPKPPERSFVERDRADWEGMGKEGWADPDVVRGRLAAGADPDDAQAWPLHRAAADGSPETVGELARKVTDVDQIDDQGETALWHAVCHGADEHAATLLAAGADAWTPRIGRWSPGRLALTTRLAPLFAPTAPEHARLTKAEHAAFEAADAQAAVFTDLHTEGISVAFLSGITPSEAIRRLGADPENPGPEKYDPYDDWDHSARVVAATAVPGGCALVQHTSYGLSTSSWLAALTTGGGRAYSLYFNPKGGTTGTLAENGRVLHREEIGLPPGEEEPEDHWVHRFWLWDNSARLWDGSELAYAASQAGVTVPDQRAVTGPPDRWAEIPQDSPLLTP